MSESYLYNFESYATLAEANAAVLELKQELDTMPTSWVEVKKLEGTPETGFVTPPDELTDDEINNLDPNYYYTVSAIYEGDTHVGVTAEEATNYINSMRAEYATNIGANVITHRFAPTVADMSGYVQNLSDEE